MREAIRVDSNSKGTLRAANLAASRGVRGAGYSQCRELFERIVQVLHKRQYY